MNKMIITEIHSIVDVITNSSTVIYTYQNGSLEPTKELINEILKLSGVTDKTANDVFYYAVLHDKYRLTELVADNVLGYEASVEELLSYIAKCIINNDIPNWMFPETSSTQLYLIPKDEKYNELALKIESLLGSVTAEEGYDY